MLDVQEVEGLVSSSETLSLPGELFTRVFDTHREEGVNLFTSKAQSAGC